LRVQLSFTLIARKTRWWSVRESACCEALMRAFALEEITMKTVGSILFAAVMTFSTLPANAVVLDLSTMSCKQFIESGDDAIKMVLTWMDGWYKGDSDEAIIVTDVFVENAKKFGAYCGKNPTVSIVNAAEAVLGK
jgi:acid stress chaperone HdeB